MPRSGIADARSMRRHPPIGADIQSMGYWLGHSQNEKALSRIPVVFSAFIDHANIAMPGRFRVGTIRYSLPISSDAAYPVLSRQAANFVPRRFLVFMLLVEQRELQFELRARPV